MAVLSSSSSRSTVLLSIFILLSAFVSISQAGLQIPKFGAWKKCLNCKNPLYCSCPARDDSAVLSKLQTLLNDNIRGQEHAIQNLLSALRVHFAEQSHSDPLVLHIVGPTGVGKTLSARLLSWALFEEKDEYGEGIGMLTLDGSQFSGRERVEESKRYISTTVAAQLKKCPRSLIVLDEMQAASPLAMDAFSEMFSKPYYTPEGSTTKIRTDQAIFLLISDLGHSQVNHIMEEYYQQQGAEKPSLEEESDETAMGGMEPEDHSAFDAKMAAALAKMTKAVEEATYGYFKRAKKAALIDQIIPFRTLNKEDLVQIVTLMMKQREEDLRKMFPGLNRVELSLTSVRRMVTYSQDMYKGESARAVRKTIDALLMPQLLNALEGRKAALEAQNKSASVKGTKQDEGKFDIQVRAGKEHGFKINFLSANEPKSEQAQSATKATQPHAAVQPKSKGKSEL